MIEYFTQEEFNSARRQRKKWLIWYFMVLGLYVASSVGLLVWYLFLPYHSPTITTVKLIHYPLTGVFVIFSFIYLGIPFKRVNRFYKMCVNLATGHREEWMGSFFEYDETLQDKEGVDFKSLVFIEWNKYKNEYFERKVLVFNEKEFPEIPENSMVKYITQSNVLISYEII